MQFLFVVLCISYVRASEPSLFEGLLKFIAEGQYEKNIELKEPIDLLPKYDFIVVGGGTAGCVIAARLSENPNWKVLLLEAGGPENYVMDIPILANYLQFSEANWNYRTEPGKNYCLGMEQGRCHWPRGKVIGGSSVLNYMIYTRGNRRDYDAWAKNGNTGWSYQDVLPYFKKVEDFTIPEADFKYHNKNGPVGVSYATYRSKIAKAIVESAKEYGMTYVDYNGEYQSGVSYIQASIKNGIRSSSSRAYLQPISNRTNLHLNLYSHVSKVIINPVSKKAIGVEFTRKGKEYKVYVTKEVILSAGAINTPQLLMLSGIGPQKHLKKFQIPLVENLKVGYNLQDHIATGGITLLMDRNYSLTLDKLINKEYMREYFLTHTGPFTVPGGCEVLTFNNLKDPLNPDGYPDVELLWQGGSVASERLLYKNLAISEEIFQQVYAPLKHNETFMYFPMLLRPKSRGRIVLNNTNWKSKPLIFPNYLDDPEDIKTIIGGIRLAQRILDQHPTKSIGTRLYRTPLPGCRHFPFDTDQYWECHTRHLTFNIYHYSGTCKMGPKWDRAAVVDPRLRVYGIEGLRVVDASIIPILPAAHTNAIVFMIGEKGADMIKQDWM